MYDPIILTLDGSKLSELALPHAIHLAEKCQTRLVLLRVVAPIVGPEDFAYGPGPNAYQKIIDEEKTAADLYLTRHADSLRGKGFEVEAVVRVGEPASTIIDYAAQVEAHLLVLATHGRSGIARWVFGSVAERVLRGSKVPILLIRSNPEEESEAAS